MERSENVIGLAWSFRNEILRTYHHPDLVLLAPLGQLHAIVQHDVHELVEAAQHAHHRPVRVQLDCETQQQ